MKRETVRKINLCMVVVGVFIGAYAAPMHSSQNPPRQQSPGGIVVTLENKKPVSVKYKPVKPVPKPNRAGETFRETIMREGEYNPIPPTINGHRIEYFQTNRVEDNYPPCLNPRR